jgi:pentatricopeptide repeat protein
MQQDYIVPTEATFQALLKAAADLSAIELGERVYGLLQQRGLTTPLLQAATMDMFVKCGNLFKATELLSALRSKQQANLIHWNILLNGYVRAGNTQTVLSLLNEMTTEGIHPDTVTYTNLFALYARLGDVQQAANVYHKALESGVSQTLLFQAEAIKMFIQCNSLPDVLKVMDKIGNLSDRVWIQIITVATDLEDTTLANALYSTILKKMSPISVSVQNAFMKMFEQCGDIEKVLSIFDQLRTNKLCTMISWTAALSAYKRVEQYDMVTKLFHVWLFANAH